MRQDALPSYDELFGDLTFRRGDESWSVYSPAAYLADLLQLLGEGDGGAPSALLGRRPDIAQVPLDADHTYTELPYLDIVNEVLERAVREGVPPADGADPYEILGGLRFPFSMPFSLRHERVRCYLHHLGVDAADLYRLFTTETDPDTVAREYLGLTPDEVTLLTTVLPDGPDLRSCYGLGPDEPFSVLEDVDRFRRATLLTIEEMPELLAQAFLHPDGAAVTLDADGQRLVSGSPQPIPVEWFDRVNRFVRLARRTGLPPAELDLVLRTCCGYRVDLAALRTIAILTYLKRALQLPLDVTASLVAPMDAALFDRVFNAPFAATERSFIRGPEPDPPAYAGLAELSCVGDLLATPNHEYRNRLVRALSIADSELAAIVDRFHRPDGSGPFDRGMDLPALSLLHRVARLGAALDIPTADLFDVLDALDRDPSIQRYPAVPLLVDLDVRVDRVDAVLAGGEVTAGLWLVQMLHGAVSWLRSAGLTGRELLGVMGAGATDGALAMTLDQLGRQLQAVELAPERFISGRFGERAAQVIHSIVVSDTHRLVCPRDDRLLLVEPGGGAAAAYLALIGLEVIQAADFVGLGLDRRSTTKIFAGLATAGYLDASGQLAPERLPASPADLRLTTDFSAYRDRLFTLIAGLSASGAGAFPSDLAELGDLPAAQRAELYDNLVYNGYLAPDGAVLHPDFFAEPANAEAFVTDADLGDIAPDVLALLVDRAERFDREAPPLDPGIFAGLGLDAGHLLDSLRFNGHLDADGRYADPRALLARTVADFDLAPQFYPHRRQVLDAMQAQLRRALAQSLRMTEDDVRDIADAAVAVRVTSELDGVVLVDGRVPPGGLAFFADPGNTLALAGFTGSENDTIFDRIAEILAQRRAYHLDLDVLADLGFTTEQQDELVDHLVGTGQLTDTLTIPEDRLGYFATVTNSLTYALAGLEDYQKDIFFLLHAAAVELTAGIEEITAALSETAARQRTVLFTVLRDAFGVPAPTVEAICGAVAGGPAAALELLAVPALAGSDVSTLGRDVSRAHRRIQGFARLAGRLGLGADDVALAFRDQNLVDKFPEPLVLPAGVDRIDALLESPDGTVHLFSGQHWWAYSATTYALADQGPRALTALSDRFAGLAAVDAAFVEGDGTEWIVGRDAGGAALAFARQRGSARWAPRAQTWGVVANAFTAPDRIDAAFVGRDERTYLFCGDQYVRYSGTDYRYVDEGYPRRIGDWWENEQHAAELPERFRDTLDAAFHGRDGRTYLFAGDQYLAIGPGMADPHPAAAPVASTWGQVRNALAGAERVDAGYTAGSGHFLFAGDQVFRYSDCLENGGVCVDPGYPRRMEPDVPAAFRGGVDAAFVDTTGSLHLFKDGQTVALSADSGQAGATAEVVPAAQRWGVLDPVLPGGVVDAVFVGLDGRTYLFSGDRYVRYSGADYSTVDSGYPRMISGDWGGLRRVDAAFVQDGVTYLFGAAGDAQSQAPVHVRYSTRDYTTPDPGYPQPLADNWWNLPDDLTASDGGFARVDAVMTGRDNRTYLFCAGRFVVFDNKRRWWSRPRSLREGWDSLPFPRVDAAFVGTDGKTYVFCGPHYVRYSDALLTRVDDRYPAPVTAFWGNVRNNIARTGRVDAAVVLDGYTYLFSGDQFVRYSGPGYSTVDPGYPRGLPALAREPRLGNLRASLDRVDAVVADRRTVSLFSGRQWHVVSDAAYRRYSDLGPVACAYLEDGAVLAERPDGWHRYSALEGTAVTTTPARPRALRAAPARLRTGLDAVLHGVDGNTYLFQGPSCFNTQLNREYPLAEEWGRTRNAIYQDNRVDAAFVGADGRTYLFSGDQFVTYPPAGEYLDGYTETGPRPIAEHWGGLTGVTLAFVRDGTTYLFEPPDPDGSARYVTYSGSDYSEPDGGRPEWAGAGFWDIPDRYRPAGFAAPDAVLFERDTMLLLTGGVCLPRNETTGTWSYPRPLERVWHGLDGAGADPADRLTAAFTGRDGTTYFFFHTGEFTGCRAGTFSPREPIRDRWGHSRNNFLAEGGKVDAAVVTRGVTYLFSGNQYARYSGTDYRYVDAGYPRPILGNLRCEEAFANLPAGFDDELAELAATGAGSLVDAALANDRTVHLFIGGACHAVSRTVTATYDLGLLGRVRNTVADRRRVDAALVTGEHTYLFSGDQYVRYSGPEYGHVDDGYPRDIAESFPGELGLSGLPAEFCNGIDAAFRDAGGRTYLFAGERYLRIEDLPAAGAPPAGAPVAEAWGVVRSEFRPGAAIDAAFVAPTGELYAFAGDQYVRYRPGRLDTAEEGYPRPIADNWGDLAPAFERGVDGAFVLAGRVYLGRGDDYVRLDGTGRSRPQPFRHRWSDSCDYRLYDVRAICRFTELARAHPHPDGLAAFLLPGPGTYADPYRHLAELFGWDAEELRWCRRRRLPVGAPADEDRFEIELLLELADLFAAAGRLGAGPSRISADVWARLYADQPDLEAAGDALRGLLARRHGPAEWPVLSGQIHDELNVRRRDALVPVVVAHGAGRVPEVRSSGDLFEWFLVDVAMGSRGRTSRVREAIAATQLYIHRYLLNLERSDTADREQVKSWWSWMRSYRVWEANRKVFLYPENYLRPELRSTRTPAFRALESDLLQGQITPESVAKAYRSYLEEYTEVSRLTIAGGYVYTKDRHSDGPRRLVLFGRTKTDPRRYYYRRAQFGADENASASWEPWQPVNLQIDADQVHPVHAFGRVFVFWAATEAVAADPGTTTVAVAGSGDEQRVSGRAKNQRVRICYSFYNLNKEWVPVQTLGAGRAEQGAVSGITLLVRPRVKDGTDRASVVVSCSYTVTTPAAGAEEPTAQRAGILFDLNPELYADDLLDATDPSGLTPDGVAVMTDLAATAAVTATADRVASIFVDPVDPAGIVRFDHPAGLDVLSWFSVDHKGGSFLCRPVAAGGTEGTRDPLAGNADRLPEWRQVDAAVELPDGTRHFFDNATHVFATTPPLGTPGEPAPTEARWGRQRSVLPQPGVVNAVLLRGDHTFVFSGNWYVRFTGTPFGAIDAGYPKPLAGNEDKLPSWPMVDAAFSGRDGIEYFFSRSRGWVTSSALDKPRKAAEHWLAAVPGFGDLDAALVTERHTYLISGRQYLRYTHPARRRRGDTFGAPDRRYPRPLAGNPDGLPTDIQIDAALWRAGTAYYFDNSTGQYHEMVDGTRQSHPIVNPPSRVATERAVDAAWVAAGRLYLTRGVELVRYTLDADGSVPDLVDHGYPRPLPRRIDTVFTRDDDVYLFTGQEYVRLAAGGEPDAAADPMPVAGAWGELPRDTAPPFDAALDSDSGLYLFVGADYVRHSKSVTVRRPYERSALPFELTRLTTGTASELNHKLLSGGIAALLDLSTQETDEVAVSTEPDPGAIQVRRRMVDPGRLPTGSHLDFRSANGLYYWEIFFHAPLLIAQALNGAQRFEDARHWYEYIFDPTNPDSCWRFLPFLGLDLAELAGSLAGDLSELPARGRTAGRLARAMAPVLDALRTLAPAALHSRSPSTEAERTALLTVTSADTHEGIGEALQAVEEGRLTVAQRAAAAGLRERLAIAAGLRKQFDALGDRDSLLRAYRDNPFDPYAIADLRPVAHRRAVVMAYIDNLLDWADLLFRQYTAETIDEARMLYILAYDLLGERPARIGTRWLPAVRSFAALDAAPGALDLTGYLTGGGALVEAGGAVHASVANEYFHIPENAAFEDYWTRVEDRLRKIRESLNILGISQPLPLFAPPLDPMALVRSVASGAGVEAVVAGQLVPPPAYRFAVVFRSAQELVDRLRQFGGELLDALERRDAEELNLLRGRQEAVILGMTRDIKQAQIRMAEERIAELTAGQTAASDRAGHYEKLVAEGLSELERAQLGLMGAAAATHFASGVLRVAAAIAYAAPQVKAGPFIVGVETGGRQLGDTIDKAAEVAESLGEGLSVVGELLGTQAQHERTVQDWQLQLKTAQSDAVQIGHQLVSTTHQLAVAQREAELLDQEIAHQESIAAFMRDRFGTAELYGWMAGQLSALYFATYQMAYEMAMAAQRAFQFERGVPEAQASHIQPVYWDSRRSGLLAGQRLALDLDRLGKAYLDTDARRLEITKQVSLLALDPLALLRLRESGSCELTLSEAELDRDFPGHYRRQLRTVTVTFVDPDGRPMWVNATLTQLNHKTVLEPDPKAVQYLLDPTGPAPETLRSDWRPSQQIALSEVDGDNNGLFELRFDDERYLPFERTGAVSTWRLRRSGRAVAHPYDVILTIRYTAANGGDLFANAVRGMLRPYPAARFFDVAREFPAEWAAFLDEDTLQLVLPLAPELFPDMSGRQIGAICPVYELAGGGGTRFVLNGNQNLTLTAGKLLPTPGLTVGASPLTLVLDGDEGDKQALHNIGLVLTYQAQAR